MHKASAGLTIQTRSKTHNSGVPVHIKPNNNISSTHEYTRLANTTCTQQQAQTSCYMLTHVTYTTYTQSSFNTQTNTHEHVDTTRTQNNGMITNVWAVLCDQEVPVTARSEARCDQEPPSPPRPPPRPHDKLWEQRLRTKGPASHQGQDAQNSKVYCFCARQW